MDVKDLYALVEGNRFVVTSCEGVDHGPDEVGCLCALKGKIIIAGKRYESVFVGTPSWYIQGVNKRFRLSEVVLFQPESE